MTNEAWLVVVLGGLGTQLIRLVFFAYAHRLVALGPRGKHVLSMIPPAALAALAIPAIVAAEGTLDLLEIRVLAGGVAALAGWYTRNVVVVLVAGFAVLGIAAALGV